MASLSSVILTPLGNVILIAALILLVIEIELSILSVRQGRSFDIVSFIGGFIFFVLILDILSEFDAAMENRKMNSMIVEFMKVPWLVIVAIEIFILILVVIRARIIYKFRKNRITRSSIKEAVDKLPPGIMILENDEYMVFSNLMMNEYVKRLTGKRLSDGKDFWNYVTAVGDKKGDRYLLQADDGSFISFKRDKLLIRDKYYDEIKAFDMTEQARITKELEEKNARLRDVQYRMKAYQVRAADMFMDQELLDARVAVHDGLGALLLQSRSYLDGNMDDEEELLKSLKYTNGFLLSESETIDDERDHYLEGLRMAEGIGVKVDITGEEVVDGQNARHDINRINQIRNILGQAIGECAANTIKHADGNEIKVQLKRVESTVFIDITNNGDPPKETIKETGGLLSIRRMVDNLKGEMYIQSDPEFRLKIILKDDVDYTME